MAVSVPTALRTSTFDSPHLFKRLMASLHFMDTKFPTELEKEIFELAASIHPRSHTNTPSSRPTC
ncbi:hypothetical protein B0H13DRAFT_2334551 [Mycena leptocephala]|nr:hypothetical protein B0H13DRAFT_2334551 [Mycena leptocephala]